MIIIPDIHGRAFWKDAVSGRETEEIIFLGDFLDPYMMEGISPEAALENFNEIIDFKKAHFDNVKLLIGNHDAHYFFPAVGSGSRYCRQHAQEIKKLFLDNLSLFQLAYEKDVVGKKFVFSHSYIHKLWLNDLYGADEWDKETVIKKLNADFQSRNFGLGVALDAVSAYRGGYESYGSMIWADVREVSLFKESNIGDYSIFGHSQLIRPIVTEYKACLDCRRGFILNDEGKICELDGTEVPIDKSPEKQS